MHGRKLLQHTLGLVVATLLLAGCGGAQGPKQGHWEGEQPFVSFDVAADGSIASFEMRAPFAASTCNITLDEVAVEGNEFLVDATTISESESSVGVFTITGNFDGTTVSGTYLVSICGTMISLGPEPKPWSAEWKSP
jgi:hypothetical protein